MPYQGQVLTREEIHGTLKCTEGERWLDMFKFNERELMRQRRQEWIAHLEKVKTTMLAQYPRDAELCTTSPTSTAIRLTDTDNQSQPNQPNLLIEQTKECPPPIRDEDS